MPPRWIRDCWYVPIDDQEDPRIILARDCKLDETILGFGNARNTCEPLYYDDQISDSESIEPTEPFAARAPEPDEEEP